MRQVKSIVCLGLLFLFSGIATSPALGDDDKNQANWDRLKQLSAGQEIQVVQNDAKSSRSNFRSVTDEAIVVSTAAGEQTIARQSILRVSSKGKGHRMRNALIGAGVGAGAGLGIGAAADHHKACTGFCVNVSAQRRQRDSYSARCDCGRHCRCGGSHGRLARHLSCSLKRGKGERGTDAQYEIEYS